MQLWLASHPTCSVVLKPCWMLLPGQSPVFHAWRTSPRRLSNCTGYVQSSASNSIWPRWLTVVSTVQPPLPVHSTYSCRWHSFSLASSLIHHQRSTCPSDAARHCWWSGISLQLKCGTNFPVTSPLPCLWQLFVVSWKHFCFMYPTRSHNLHCYAFRNCNFSH